MFDASSQNVKYLPPESAAIAFSAFVVGVAVAGFKSARKTVAGSTSQASACPTTKLVLGFRVWVVLPEAASRGRHGRVRMQEKRQRATMGWLGAVGALNSVISSLTSSLADSER